MVDAATMRARAAEIAEEVLFPAAMSVDRAGRVPAGHLDLLAEEGFYGIAAPPEAGGLGADDTATAAYLVETLASGCLTTAFVWLQHHGCVRAAAASRRPGVTARWLDPLARGERRGGIALAGIRPSAGAAGTRVRPVDGGFLLTGEAPWVTGWDMIDTVQVAARDAGDVIHYLLVDAAPAATLTVRPLELVAVQASRTVTLTFTDHFVPADRLTGTQPYGDWMRSDASGSVLNGALALGVARRCCRLLGPGPLDAELDAARAALLGAGPQSVPDSRAAASQLALRAAQALTVHTGSRAVLRDNHAQRLVREAAFLLVFGSRPAIRDALLRRVGAVAPDASGPAGPGTVDILPGPGLDGASRRGE